MPPRTPITPQSQIGSDVRFDNNGNIVQGILGLPLPPAPIPATVPIVDPNGSMWSFLDKLPASMLALLVGDVNGSLDSNQVSAITGAGITAVNNAVSPYTVALTDLVLLVDCFTGNVVIDLPAATTHQVIVIRRTDSSANTVTLMTTGSDTINGIISVTMPVLSYAILVSNGSANWYTMEGSQDGTAPPSGAAGGDLNGTYPNPGVAKANGTALGATDATAWDILAGDGSVIKSRAFTGAPQATATVPGLVPTPPNDATKFLRGDATFAVPPSATATVAGYVPTPPNDVTKFLRGDATFAVPPSATATTPGYVPTPPNDTLKFLRGDAVFAIPANVSPSLPGFAPAGASLVIPNVALIGKSLGGGTTVTASISSGVATITHTSHGYAVGDIVVMAGNSSGSAGDFNQLHAITGVTTNTYTFATTGTAVSGTILEMFWFSGTRSLGVALIKNITRSSAGNYQGTFVNTQSNSYFGINYAACCSAGVVFSSLSSTAPTITTFNMIFRDDTGSSKDADLYLKIEFAGIV